MTSISEQIRILARSGSSVSEISRKLGIRYQHAYKVCRDAELLPAGKTRADAGNPPQWQKRRPALSVAALLKGGFVPAGRWEHGDTRLACPSDLPQKGGVYAFSIDDEVVYVGLASRSLAQRLYHYGRPGPSQRTNIRLNALIREALASDKDVDIHYACPPSLDWNGFAISGPEGLEAGIIRAFHLPWNVRGA